MVEAESFYERNQGLGILEFQGFRVFRDFRVSGFQGFRVLGFQGFRVLGF